MINNHYKKKIIFLNIYDKFDSYFCETHLLNVLTYPLPLSNA